MKIPLLATLLLLLFVSPLAVGKSTDYGKGRIKKMSWDGLDVVWLQDERFPTYSIQIYFADGALGDGKNGGLANATFDLLSMGTRRFNQKQISDNLEYFGVSHGAEVSHESSTYEISGTVKHIIPTMMKICHLFKDASYPPKELKNYKKRFRSNLKSLVNSHGRLADRAFREISMRGTPFRHPTEGKLRNIKKITPKKLKKNLLHFNNKVKKRIYLYGPQKVLSIQKIVLNECGWNPQAGFVRKASYKKKLPKTGPKIHLITVPHANQSQIRMGRYLNESEIEDRERHDLMNDILAGDFTSLLMKELRVNNGWVYYVSSYSGGQRDYGRAILTTATKNKNLLPLLKTVRKSLRSFIDGEFSQKQFKIAKNALAEKHPFRFQRGGQYLSELSKLDHLEKDYAELYRFPKRVRKHSLKSVQRLTRNIFSWNKQTIVILGPARLKKVLKKLGPVRVTNYKKYL